MEFKPRRGHLQDSRVLPKGSELLTNAVGPEAVVCKFITTQDVNLNPISLHNMEKKVDTKGRGILTLNFIVDNGVKLQNLNLDPLRIYIHGETPTALAVHELFIHHVIKAEVNIDNGKAIFEVNRTKAVSAGGFKEVESLLPGDPRSFWGYALLMEYFVFPEKFLFLNLHGLDKLPVLDPPPSRFSITYTFNCDFPTNKPFGHENFRMSCSPAVNLFKQDTEPVSNSGKATEYLVRADSRNTSSVTHSILSVVGVDRKTGERFSYEPFHTFKAINKKNTRSYTTQYHQGFSGKRELSITIGGNQLKDGTLREENLSIEGWCTNGILPREELREGSISKPGQDFPDFVMFTNITRPTLPIQPPAGQDYLWVFLSHLSSTYSSFSSADSLKTFLKLYDWSHSEGSTRRIDAITNVTITPTESLLNGGLLRGIQFTVDVQDSQFADTGDLHLFGAVLKEFFSQYVSINSFVDLVIVAKPSGKQTRWNSLKGKKCPI